MTRQLWPEQIWLILCDIEKQGSPAWLAIYTKAAAEVAAQLSGEEREEVNDLVERWNTQGLPEEEKKK